MFLALTRRVIWAVVVLAAALFGEIRILFDESPRRSNAGPVDDEQHDRIETEHYLLALQGTGPCWGVIPGSQREK